jgi:hypothetical protein
VIARLLTLPTAVWLLATLTPPLDLRPETLKAFDRYVQLTEERISKEISGAVPFLWIDRLAASSRTGTLERLKKGGVVVARLETRDGKKEIQVPDGLVHHWIGTVLLPQVTLDRTVAFVTDYPRYPAVFAPLIQRAKVQSQMPERFDVTMRTWGKKVGVEVVIDADYAIEYRRFGPTKLYTRSVASNIHEVTSPGTPNETLVPAAKSRGFMWAINTYCSFEERTEGVYEQCESISLTRTAMWLVRALASAVAGEIPRETLEMTLSKVRAGVVSSESVKSKSTPR